MDILVPSEVTVHAPTRAPLPFQVIVQMLQTSLCSFWITHSRRHQVIGSMALRNHIDPTLVASLSSGLIDLDMLVDCDLASFESVGRDSYSFLLTILAHSQIPPVHLEYKIQVLNKVVLIKYFWHTFRIADIQWVPADYPYFDSISMPLFPGQDVQVASIAQLRAASERVLAGIHDGLPGDNRYRMEKDAARLKLLSIEELWNAKPRPSAAIVTRSLVETSFKWMDAFEEKVIKSTQRVEAKCERVASLVKPLVQRIVKQRHAYTASLTKKDASIATRDSRIKSLEQQVNTSSERNQYLTTRIEELQQRVDDLEQIVQERTSRCESLVKERSTMQQRIEAIGALQNKYKEIERANRAMTKQIETFEINQVKERLLFIDTIQSLMISLTTYRFALHKSTELLQAMMRSLNLIYSMRNQLSSMFSTKGFQGTAFPQTVEAFASSESTDGASQPCPTDDTKAPCDKDDAKDPKALVSQNPDEFVDVGRGDIANAVTLYMESFGPFGKTDENAYMCGWRDSETIVDYLQRINGYILEAMTRKSNGYSASSQTDAPLRDSEESVDANDVIREQRVQPYFTTRVRETMRNPSTHTEGGLCVRVPLPGETSSSIDDKQEEYADKSNQHQAWMYQPIRSYIFEIKQDVSLCINPHESPEESSRQTIKFLKEDWMNDPSIIFRSLGDFSRVRSVSNIITALTSVVWSRISISCITKIHKQARIATNILHEVQENEEYAESFGSMFMLRAERAMVQLRPMLSPVDENVILASPTLFDLVQSIVQPFSILKGNHQDAVCASKHLISLVVPPSILRGAEAFTKQTFMDMCINVKDIGKDVDKHEEPVKNQQQERLRQAIQSKSQSRRKKK